jgi:hypothetical protein
MKALGRIWLFAALCAVLGACGDDDGGGGGGVDAGADEIVTYQVTGTVVDFETGVAVTDPATVSVPQLSAAGPGIDPPAVTTTGADFTITNVPPFSVFNILSGSPPNYGNTYNAATVVDETNVSGVEAIAVSNAFIAAMQTEFNVTPVGGTSAMLVHVVDENGQALAGVPAAAFEVNNAAPVDGPYFLDANKMPDSQLNQTSASGWVVFYQLQPGQVAVNAADGSNFAMVMPVSPAAENVVTVAELTAAVGMLDMLPVNVSFANDVRPIFERRGCELCHSGNGIGRDLGNLTLNGSNNLIYREVTEELSPNGAVTRVDLINPAMSMLLTRPDPTPDAHPNTTFASTQDPDYLIILGWITEGALDN